MNNFTKDELQYLMSCIYERPNSINPTMEAMRDKLQSLIDNYNKQGVSSANHNEIQGPADTYRR
jgi:hypothetical protein